MMDFDFQTLGIGLAGISLGGIGMIMAGYFLFPETAERYKKQIPTVMIGLVLVAVSGAIIGFLQ
ncbi:MAG: hypothetical protein DRI77_14750 [Chloroflexi bacterium]|nr:MAG: hypothetical protein DRI77_14750 [Chloroflexota bacterium]